MAYCDFSGWVRKGDAAAYLFPGTLALGTNQMMEWNTEGKNIQIHAYMSIHELEYNRGDI